MACLATLCSSASGVRSSVLSTYEKELLSLVIVVQKWRPYLLGQSFKVKIDQQALKFLLEQRAGTVSQQCMISKLLGYDFVIEYKKGKESDTLSISLISFPTPDWIESFIFTQSGF